MTPPTGMTYPVLLFADDTLLLTNTADEMTNLLALTIDHSKPYNLTLNTAKCQLLVTNDMGAEVYFPDTTPATKHATIKYLGTLFSSTLDVGMIIRSKLTDAAQILRQLSPLWSDQTSHNSLEISSFQCNHQIQNFLHPGHPRTDA